MWLVSNHLLSIVGFLLGLLLSAKILSERRAPSSTLAWLLVVGLIPYIGVPLYLVLGDRKVQKKKNPQKPSAPAPSRSGTAIERTLITAGAPPSAPGHRLELLSTGTDAFAAIIAAIEEATDRIYVTTFILGDDAAGNGVLAALTSKASAGVEVRLLLDGFFAGRPSRARLDELRRAGGKVGIFLPILRLPWRGHANLRNHRKLLVVDGRVGILGGMNLAIEYMGPEKYAGRWRDLAVRVRGAVARDLVGVFVADWQFATGERLPEATAPPEAIGPSETIGSAVVEVAPSGPDASGDAFYDAVLTGLFAAKERIWIATPYFIPDDALVRALLLAIRRGVDVRIFVPARSNHLTADLAGAGYLRDIAAEGGRIHRYLPGMLHAKSMILDDNVGIVGSANLDMRSLFLDYEVSLFVYSPDEIAGLARWFDSLLPECVPGVPQSGRVRAAIESVGRLLAPVV